MCDLVERLLTPERRRFVKFGIVGVSGVGVNLLFVHIGTILFADLSESTLEAAASALGIVVSVLTNFILNDLWTWSDRKKGSGKRDFFVRMGTFYLTAAVAAVFQFGTAQLLAQGLDWSIYIAQLIGIGLGMVINFVVNNVWTFRDKEQDRGDSEETEDEIADG